MSTDILGTFILAGGRSSRFGSDKARAMIHGQPLVLRLVQQVALLTQRPVTLVVNEPQRYSDFAIPAITDVHPDLGPMGGLYSAIDHIVKVGHEGWILLLPCDLLDYDEAWHHRLCNPLEKAPPHAQAIAFFDKDWLPFPALYHSRLLPNLSTAIQSKQFSPRKFLSTLGPVAIAASTEQLPELKSANTVRELESYLRDTDSCSPQQNLTQ
jgi:molybdopterin-guanine dinucleotide biosynthesis protein A